MSDAYIARLCVLYEDLRIEVLAISEVSIPSLDVLDPARTNVEQREVGRYRRNYFLRRSIGTLAEFAEGLRLLAGCPDYTRMLENIDPGNRALWTESVEFFQAKEVAIKNVRNDIGGHFGASAAIYAVDNLKPTAVGKIEYQCDSRSMPTKPFLHFAGEIAATSFLRHLPGVTDEEKVKRFFEEVLLEGYKAATKSVHFLLAVIISPRFGR